MVWQPRFKALLTSQATGTSGSMLNISKAKFEETNAIYPDIESQQKFRDIYWKVQNIFLTMSISRESLFEVFIH